MNFFKIGDWQTGKPVNSQGKYYALTLEDNIYKNPCRIVSDHIYRYDETTDVWEIYDYDMWSVFTHPFLKIVAYAQAERLKPYEEEEVNDDQRRSN